MSSTPYKSTEEVLNKVWDDEDNILKTALAYNTATNTKVSVGVASTAVLVANTTRKYAIFVNDSANVIYLSLSGTAVINEGIRLNASGGAFEVNSTNLYQGAISAIATGAGSNLTVCEG